MNFKLIWIFVATTLVMGGHSPTEASVTSAGFISPYVGYGFNPIASSLYGYGLGLGGLGALAHGGYGGYGYGWGKSKNFGYGMGGMGGMGGLGGIYAGKFPFFGYGMGYPYYGLGGFGYPFYGGMGLGGLAGFGGFGGLGGYGGYGMGGLGGYGGYGMGGLGLLKKSESDYEASNSGPLSVAGTTTGAAGDYYKRMAQDEAMIAAATAASTKKISPLGAKYLNNPAASGASIAA